MDTEVLVIVHELMRVATGNPVRVHATDGRDVLLRLATPDEVQAFERDARANLVAQGACYCGRLMTAECRAEIERTQAGAE